jgi:hypothetical protein
MAKEKYALMVIAAGVVLVIASVLLMLFSGPKDTPWELTNTLLPGEVQNTYIWYENNKCTVKTPTEEQITEVVHLINRLEKEDYIENTASSSTPAYALHLFCGEMKMTLQPLGGAKTEIIFDAKTAEALKADRWVVNDDALAGWLLAVSGYTG